MHDTLLMVFTGILAVAVLMQSVLFFLMYRSIRQLTDRIDSLSKELRVKVEVVSTKLNDSLAVIKGIASTIQPIAKTLADTTEIVHKRVIELDKFFVETTSSARLEILRIQDTIQSASRRVQETLETLHNSMLAPINEISAITRAIRVATDIFFRRRKNVSDSSAQDEEMFI